MASKKTTKRLRELALIAYERDLSRCIDVLRTQMDTWKNGEITVWDVEQSIHEFHNNIARALYRSYAQGDPIFAVAFGIAQGVITADEVPEEVREQTEQLAKRINPEG